MNARPALSLLFSLISSNALAATFTVPSPVDTVDALPGDGICADIAGICTLRAAVLEANALPGPDVILISVDRVTLRIPGRGEDAAWTGDLDVTEDLMVMPATAGFRPIIDAASLDRIWHVETDASLSLTMLQMIKGQAYDSTQPVNYGGGILIESVIDPVTLMPTWPLLTMDGCVLLNNFVTGNLNTHGGGLAALGGDAMVLNSELNTNGVNGYGGGIYTNASAVLDFMKSTATQNRAKYGGGLSTSGSTNLYVATISNNTATAIGGGVYSANEAAWIDYSVLHNNRSASFGGGLFAAASLIATTNSTYSTNQSGRGGGVASRSSTIDFLHATIHRNRATVQADSGGVWADPPSVLTAANTVLARNNGGTAADCAATFTSNGGNFVGFVGTTTACIGFGAPFDQLGVGIPINPGLMALANYGGPTWTHRPTGASLLVDAGDPGWCAADDQRFFARPVGSNCDIGAQEGP